MLDFKELPNSKETEQHLLGLVIWNDDNGGTFSEIACLEPDVFYNPHCRAVYLAMHALADRNEPIHLLSLFEEVKASGGASLTLSDLSNWSTGLPVLMQPQPLMAILKDKHLKRQLIARCERIAGLAAGDDDMASNIAAQAATTFQETYAAGVEGQKPTASLDEAFDFSVERWDKMLRREIVTVPTGFRGMDAQLTGGGLEKGMFHLIGARPGKGKTSMALDIAVHNALQGNVVVFFTMELSRDVLMDRLVAPLAGVERYKIASDRMTEYEYRSLVAVKEMVKGLPLYLNHKARTPEDIKLALRDIARKTGGRIDLVIVDFLTKMRLGRGSKYEAVSANVNGLAELAPEFNCASLCLAQLSRPNVKRQDSDGRVELTDFRDSGEIEELGRTIFGLWSPEEVQPGRRRRVICSCIKQGEGRLFEEDLIFDTHLMTFGSRQCLIRGQAEDARAA